MNPTILFFIIFASLLALSIVTKLIIKVIGSDSPTAAKVPNVVPVPRKPKKTDREAAREKRNFDKAQQKARRQGHIRFCYHDAYYLTGLAKVDGTGK